VKLPHRNNVLISREKLVQYILSETHALGRFKAKFFQSLGFNKTNVHLFEESLRTIAKFKDVKDVISSPYGTKYVLDGRVKTPTGKIVKLRTVRIIEKGQNRPRFVTTYPV